MSDLANPLPMPRAGECWIYRPLAGFEASRLLIGAVVTFEDREAIVCCAVTHAPTVRPDGALEAATIPFLPLTAGAFAASVEAKDAATPRAVLPDAFAEAFQMWQADERGLAAFTQRYDGRLDHLIAREMAGLVARSDGSSGAE